MRNYGNPQNCCQRAAEGSDPYTFHAGVGLLAGPFVRNFDLCYENGFLLPEIPDS